MSHNGDTDMCLMDRFLMNSVRSHKPVTRMRALTRSVRCHSYAARVPACVKSNALSAADQWHA